MPEIFVIEDEVRHTDDMQDIITAIPGWILRWGITAFFFVLMILIGLSEFISYPDIVKAQLKINSPNSPKPVVAKIQGKLVKLLIGQNAIVKVNQPLAYMESTANHDEVISLLSQLKTLNSANAGNPLFNAPTGLQLGELQQSYQTFYQAYLTYKSAEDNGFYLKKKAYLKNDLKDISKTKDQLQQQKVLQEKDLSLANDEYEMHKKLAVQKVEAQMELKQNESKYLARKSPLIQTESALITSDNNYSAKQKELLELDNTIAEEKSKFTQSLNSLISEFENWQSKYILTASQAGKISFAGIVQEGQVLSINQDVFYINPGNEQFFGDMNIPQLSLGKVKEGQEVLIKLKSYPYEEYGMLRGRINYIADVPYKDSIFVSRVDFKLTGTTDMKKPIHLKQGMMADAEIITQNATILSRITRNILKILK
jgi:multidrug efflux pump subunit AcrA (membrane-fusion protein)